MASKILKTVKNSSTDNVTVLIISSSNPEVTARALYSEQKVNQKGDWML